MSELFPNTLSFPSILSSLVRTSYRRSFQKMSKKRYSLFRWRCRKLEIKLPVIPGSKIFRINSWANLESRRLWRANICIRNIFLLLLIFSRTFQTFPTLKKIKNFFLVQNRYVIIELKPYYFSRFVRQKFARTRFAHKRFKVIFAKKWWVQNHFANLWRFFLHFRESVKNGHRHTFLAFLGKK